MSLTLLLDLDGTLIDNDVDSFIPHYFKLFSTFFSSFAPEKNLLNELKLGTMKMISNSDENQTLENIFDTEFYPGIGITKNELLPHINQFYTNEFPKLQTYTHILPEAKNLVDFAFKRGYDVVIATNPLFPRSAIEERLRWANLPVSQYPYKLITSYETFHFAKPNPAFYSEILCQLGWPDSPVVMVGNDPEMDIRPSGTVGMMTYLLDGTTGKDNGRLANRVGSLSDLPEWLEMKEEAQSISVKKQPKSVISVLQATLAVLPGMLRNHPAARLIERMTIDELDLLKVLRQIAHPQDISSGINSDLEKHELFFELRRRSLDLLKSIDEDQLNTLPVPGGDGSTTVLDYLHAFALSECLGIRKYAR